MGVERSVTRWYAQRQVLLDEIAALEARLSQSPIEGQGVQEHDGDRASEPVIDTLAVQQKLADARSKLERIGPCPKPMMG